ncbi:hypothetical protein T11_10362 [Trichinella zimbabwensis]|uniref:Uncharacterized protein n=1 Tax=Trichinella zimbabwensis TaxID=268475 RepID=A0A0V1GLV2_9BILA|nr:hypothetical protein T11_10362 [Trichinella zimbabwensis]
MMDECSDEPEIRAHLGQDDYMSLLDACVERRLNKYHINIMQLNLLSRIMGNLHKKPHEEYK